ncbi:MAG: hypothetical protein Hyperionvirus19_45 [Hyperionvirus sp.]|uniref:Uncharacterized protein n=1 Tax=Hyperionvirus sp. TaxID=2487770 RepID=A0A3G5AD74_9VIRU|nr:MAG: hypothetical protein Hyperionvirus19_45 [Hyperionvirus sp.]
MTHFYERNIVEIKNDYTMFLTNIIAPLIYEGIRNVYTKARKTAEDFEKAHKENPDVKNPGVLKIFQAFLTGVKNLNNHNIENETNRIKEKSKCSEWFDDLLRAVVKSYIVLLTYNASGKTCRLVHEKYHDKIDAKSFIHKCYVECARLFFNYPELFWHGFTTLEIKRNQREAHDIIKTAIKEAIRKLLPMKLILEEYLKNEYIQDDNNISEDIPNSQYQNMRGMVQKDLEGDNANAFKIVDSDEDDLGEDIENAGMVDINTLIKDTGNTVFAKHEVVAVKEPEKEPVVNNTEVEMERRLGNPGYIKSPRNVKASKNAILKDAVETYKKQQLAAAAKMVQPAVLASGPSLPSNVPSTVPPGVPTNLPANLPPKVPLNVAPPKRPINKYDDISEDIDVDVVQRFIKPEN